MENEFNELMDALDDIQYRRAERSLPKKQLAKMCLEALSRARHEHEAFIKYAILSLREVKNTLDDDYESYGNKPLKKHCEFVESFSCESDTCRVEAKLCLNSIIGSTGLSLSFVDNRQGSKHSINALRTEKFNDPNTAAKIAASLIDHGHGTASTVEAIEKSLRGLFSILKERLESLDKTIDEAAGCKLEGTIPEKCKKLRSMDKDVISERTVRLLPLCMKAVEPLKGMVQHLGETVSLIMKAEETFGDLQEEMFSEEFEDNSLRARVFNGSNMIVEVLIQKWYDDEQPRLLVCIDGSYERDNWCSEPEDFERTFIEVLSTRTIGSRQAENLPKALEEAVAQIERTADEARKIIKEKIESELK